MSTGEEVYKLPADRYSIMPVITSKCRAKNPETCSYHGAAMRMESALQAKDPAAYLKAKEEFDQAASEKLKELERQSLLPAPKLPKANRRNPIILPDNPLTAPSRPGTRHTSYYDQYPHRKIYNIETKYDSYGAPWGEEDDEYGRNSVYENLRIDEDQTIDVKNVLAQVFNTREGSIPPDLEKYAYEIGINDLDSYETHVYGGYYGEEHEVLLEETKIDQLRAWYYNRYDNAKDASGVLEYVRQNGQPTKGLDQIEAVKEYVKSVGRPLKIIDQATNLNIMKIKRSKLTINQTAYKNATPAPAQKSNGKGNKLVKYDGVVILDKGQYRLLAGFAQVKNLKTDNSEGNFLVLS